MVRELQEQNHFLSDEVALLREQLAAFSYVDVWGVRSHSTTSRSRSMYFFSVIC